MIKVDSKEKQEIFNPPLSLKSKVWTHFVFCKKGDALDKSLAVHSRVCKAKLKYSANTTNLSMHLLRCHGIARFICKDMRSYSVFENPGFQEMIQTQIQLRTLYEKVKMDLQLSLSQAERVAIMTDGWMSCSTQGYVTITSHHINREWNMENFV